MNQESLAQIILKIPLNCFWDLKKSFINCILPSNTTTLYAEKTFNKICKYIIIIIIIIIYK